MGVVCVGRAEWCEGKAGMCRDESEVWLKRRTLKLNNGFWIGKGVVWGNKVQRIARGGDRTIEVSLVWRICVGDDEIEL
jgi:hypothetical protein